MMKPYPDYKDSGVAWLGKIPAHWKVILVKNFYHIQLGKMLQPEKKLHDDLSFPYLKALHVQWFRVEQESLPEMWGQPSDIEKYGVKSGDLLVCEGGEGGRAAIIANLSKPCIIQNALHRVRSKAGSNLKFLQYVMFVISSTGWFDAICNKATIAHFTKEKFGSLKIAIPPIEEQTKIVLFLDEKIAKIDRFIANKQRMAALLREQKQAIISAAVTGQLNACDSCAPCGSCVKKFNANDANDARDARAWFGEIPSHWEVKRAKYYFKEVDIRSTTGLEELLSVSHITGVTPRSEKNIYMFKAENYEGYKLCDVGDIVINTMWAWMAAVGVSKHFGIVSSSYHTYKQINPLTYDDTYLDMLLRTNIYKNLYVINSKGVTDSRLRLYPESFLKIPFVRPPIEEQKRIVSWIQQSCKGIDITITRIEREIALMQEYRARLIADVVTGQIDAREKI